ncbi:MAG: DUF4416 family protein [Planctomycetes bacterium]|nr:DUF4416 family protein [Planctomycetota bacterium]
MAEIHHPPQVKLIVGIISKYADLFEPVEEKLFAGFGVIDLKSDIMSFEFTDYYTAEMGAPLKRQFLAFQKLIDPAEIASIKIRTNQIENDFASKFLDSRLRGNDKEQKVSRPVNLDPGYVDNSKLVLASTKDYAHRIYLQDGIYAEVTLQYSASKRSFQPCQWTYPDYQTQAYLDFFNRVREMYRKHESHK